MNEQTKPRPQTEAALAAPMPSKHSFKPLKQCRTLEEAFQTHEFMERIQASVPQHVQPGRMLRTFISAVSKTPLLAQADLRTYLGACLTCSQVGLEPNTPLGHIWLLPFKRKIWNPETRKRDKEIVEVNVIFGYPGLLDLSFRTTKVKAIHADVVWPGDEFEFEYGSNSHLKHRPRGHKDDDRPLYAYMHAGLDGGQAFEVMPYEDVLRIRNRSQAYIGALAAKEEAASKGWREPLTWTEAPWVRHEIAMARKTAFRSGSKWLPRSVELANVIALDEAQERRRHMDFAPVMDAPTIDGTPDYLSAAADAAQGEDEPDGPGGTNPGTAFGDRRPIQGTPAPQQETQSPASRQQTPAEPDFEAYLVDADGTPNEQPHTDPTDFATAFAAHYATAKPDAAAALREYNEDALDQARQHAKAAAILAALEDPRDRQTTSQTVIARVEPPVEHGKTQWPAYVRLIKTAIADLGADRLPAWLERQRADLAQCPIAQRALMIRAIAERCGAVQIDPPAWLGGLGRAGKSPAPSASPPATVSGPPPAQTPPPDQRTADEKWVDNRIADLRAMTRIDDFNMLVGSGAVQKLMSRLARENRPLFDRANAAFTERQAQLTPPPTDPDDGPPGDDPTDPGYGGAP